MSTESVMLSTHGDVAVIRIDTGQRLNEIPVRTWDELEHVVEGLHRDPPRAAVFVGRTDCFTAGLALSDVTDMSAAEFRAFVELEYRCIRRVEELPFVTVAAISGPCIGNGAELVLACDQRVTSPTLRFGLPEVAVGFMGPTQRLLRYVNVHQARNLLLSSALLSAQEALAMNLVDDIAEGDSFPLALERAQEAATLAPLAVALTKRNLLDEAPGGTRSDAREIDAAVQTFVSADRREGIEAFLQGRTPNYLGI